MTNDFIAQLDNDHKNSKKKSVEEFIDFLKDRGIYRQFKENLEKDGRYACIEVFLSETWKNGLMMEPFQGFLWADTGQDEGFQFWNAYDTEWNKLYYKKEGM